MNPAILSKIKPLITESYIEPILTFDIDWAHDEVLEDTIELVESFNAKAVWFVTHDTILLERLRSNPNFELGIHPNFNFLLNGDDRNGKNAEEVVDRLLEIVPDAKSVRSHSVTQSSRLSQLFLSKGLTHESNDYTPVDPKLELHPWFMEIGLIKTPYCWSDELNCIKASAVSVENIKKLNGLKIFDFHPIHVFLNTENLERYEISRKAHYLPSELITFRNQNYGTRNILIEFLSSNSHK